MNKKTTKGDAPNNEKKTPARKPRAKKDSEIAASVANAENTDSKLDLPKRVTKRTPRHREPASKKIVVPVLVVLGLAALGLLIGSFLLDNISMFIVGSLVFVAALFVYFYILPGSKKRQTQAAKEETDESLPLFLRIGLLMALGAGFLVALYYLMLPALSLSSVSFIFYLTLCLLGAGGLTSYIVSKFALGKKKKRLDFNRLSRVVSLCIVGASIVFSVIGGLSGAQNFRAKDYAKMLPIQTIDDPAVTARDFSLEDGGILLPSIDKDLSYRQAQIAVGEFGNQYYIDQRHLSIQSVTINGERKLVRVAPLEYSNLIVSLQNNSRGTPGFVMVDAETGEVSLHTDKRIVYTTSAKLSADLLRHIRLNNLGLFFDNFYFEIDNDFNPYWIVPCYRKTIGLFGGKNPSEVLAVDAESGKISNYSIESAPDWIDNVVDRAIVEKQAIYALKYQRGWINATIGSREGVYQLNDGYNYFVKDGQAFYVSSVTSKDLRDQTSIGFLTINLSTREAKLYKDTGITEGRAMSIAQLDGSVKALSLAATWPCFISVRGVSTYFLTLKNSVKTQKYVFMDQNTGEKLAIANTREEAFQQYLIAIDQGSSLDAVSGRVARVNFLDSNVYFSLDSAPETVYAAPLELDARLSLLAAGDTISFKAYTSLNEAGYREVLEISEIDFA